MNKLNFDEMDNDVFENYNVTKCVNKAVVGKGYMASILGLSIVLLVYFAMKNELLNYPLTKDSTFIIVVISYLFIIPLHELLHYIPLKIFKYNPELHLLHNSIEGLVKREHLIIALLTPLIIISSVFIVLSLIFPTYSLLFIFLLGTHVMNCRGDLADYFLIRKFTKNCFIGFASDKEYRGYL